MSEKSMINRSVRKEQKVNENYGGSEQKNIPKFQIGDIVVYGTNGVCVIRDCV